MRIQALLEHDGSLSLNLLDMSEGGKAGAAVTVTGNGPVMLPEPERDQLCRLGEDDQERLFWAAGGGAGAEEGVEGGLCAC